MAYRKVKPTNSSKSNVRLLLPVNHIPTKGAKTTTKLIDKRWYNNQEKSEDPKPRTREKLVPITVEANKKNMIKGKEIKLM